MIPEHDSFHKKVPRDARRIDPLPKITPCVTGDMGAADLAPSPDDTANV
jgi:hypothetical protein